MNLYVQLLRVSRLLLCPCCALAVLLLAVATSVSAQSLRGTVTDADTREAIPFAIITAISAESNHNNNTVFSVQSDMAGAFDMEALPAAVYRVAVRCIGYQPDTLTLTLPALAPLYIALQPASFQLAMPVLISATRANHFTPVAYTYVGRAELDKNNTGVDVPYLLQSIPAAVVSSDAGAGIGYTALRIRGADATRTNVTINGVPLNDSESQAVYWVDLPDFASSVQGIQVQRGVGTSTNGANAFGATINLESNRFADTAFAWINVGGGSFDTRKAAAQVGTGLLRQRWALQARLSAIQSGGFIDRATSDLRSFHISAAYNHLKKNHSLYFHLFSGHEITYQAWYGVPLDILQSGNRTYNPAGFINDSTFYEQQEDNYRQTHYQLHWNHQPLHQDKWSFSATLHYTRGGGYYEEYRPQDDVERYGVAPFVVGDTAITTADFVRRRHLNNDFYGFIGSAVYQQQQHRFILGAALNQYLGVHFGTLVWGQYIGNYLLPAARYYENDALKNDYNAFVKYYFTFKDKLTFFADAQLRAVYYDYLGFDANLLPLQQAAHLFFFNPKGGVVWNMGEGKQCYASVARASHEPNRNDFVAAPPQQQPISEQLTDYEAGYRWSRGGVRFQGNVYYMYFKNQLALNGGINDVGEYTRVNIPRSYRVGIELEAALPLHRHWFWNGNIAWSRNKALEFDEVVDAFLPPDYNQKVHLHYQNTDLALSPAVVAYSELLFKPHFATSIQTEISWISKYVSRQYLDNTQNKNADLAQQIENIPTAQRFIAPAWINDMRLRMILTNSKVFRQMAFTLQLRNLLNARYEANGYTFRYIAEDASAAPALYESVYLFPQAGRNVLLGMEWRF